MRNIEKLYKFVQYMQAKNNTKSTIDIYKHHLELFFEWANEDSSRISANTIQRYIFQIPSKLSFSYKNHAISSIKYCFSVIEGKKFEGN
jgi:hypothetical protein